MRWHGPSQPNQRCEELSDRCANRSRKGPNKLCNYRTVPVKEKMAPTHRPYFASSIEDASTAATIHQRKGPFFTFNYRSWGAHCPERWRT